MKSSKIITLCSSASMYQELIRIEKQLLKLGFKVKVPKSARKMEKEGSYEMKGKKAWMEDPSLFPQKTALMDAHFKKIEEGDAILVVNLDKGGVKGYIGGNVLMEMMLAYWLKKPIYIWRNVMKDHPFYEEIIGMKAIFLEENLQKLFR